jgi:hypothetical protein
MIDLALERDGLNVAYTDWEGITGHVFIRQFNFNLGSRLAQQIEAFKGMRIGR